MSKHCRCERCSSVVVRSRGPIHRKIIYFALYGLTLPYAWLLFVAGPGVVGVLPIVLGIGLGISGGLSDWAFPDPNCSRCGAALEWAPEAPAPEVRSSMRSAASALKTLA